MATDCFNCLHHRELETPIKLVNETPSISVDQLVWCKIKKKLVINYSCASWQDKEGGY